MTLREVVWVSHPYGQNPANLARAKRWVAYLERKHPEWIICAPWIDWAESGTFADDEPAAIEACKREIGLCGKLVSVGTREPSPGMRSEWMHALHTGLGVLVYSTEAEPPDPLTELELAAEAYDPGHLARVCEEQRGALAKIQGDLAVARAERNGAIARLREVAGMAARYEAEERS